MIRYLATHSVPNVTQHQSDINLLLSKVPNTKDKETIKIFERIINTISESNKSLLSQNILKIIPASTKNKKVLNLALQNIKSEHVDQETLSNVLTIVNKLSQLKSKDLSLDTQHCLTEFFTNLNKIDKELILKFETSIIGFENIFNRSLLISLYLQKGQILKAYEYAKNIIAQKQRLRGSCLELIIHHLSHREQLDKASQILNSMIENNYEIYPRTYSVFFNKAIDLNNNYICMTYFDKIIGNTYIDNGSLIRLAEIISDVGFIRQIREIFKRSLMKGSIPRDHLARYYRLFVEMKTRSRGFIRGFKFLSRHYESKFNNTKLNVLDYPNLLEKVIVSAKEENVSKTVLKRLSYKEPFAIKRFYLDLVVQKLIQNNNLEIALQMLVNNNEIGKIITDETIRLILLSSRSGHSMDNSSIKLLIELLVKHSIKLSKLSDIYKLNLLRVVISNEESWIYSFKLIQLIDYKFNSFKNEQIHSEEASLKDQLIEKCQLHGYIDRVEQLKKS
ncbi:hypothetical protein WICMUC_005534 [Wickerhamomyces mucosus]|uniref:Uncharacterized protein n=1 Tax=Wickerhamomyces mucosus TaxID=1378264 RepID=A0A9P8P8E2_9ASCO|nr:hypothetical protein WICMUC_005534 [Wickerhamomyces mucosus]